MRVVEGCLAAAGFAEVDDPALVLDTIKRAEDSDSLILRLYEAHGGRGTARVRVNVPFSKACRTDLLESEGDELPTLDGTIEVAYRPWELITVALRS